MRKKSKNKVERLETEIKKISKINKKTVEYENKNKLISDLIKVKGFELARVKKTDLKL